MGSIPGWGTKIPHAAEQLSLVYSYRAHNSGAHMPQQRALILQLRLDATKQIHFLFNGKLSVWHCKKKGDKRLKPGLEIIITNVTKIIRITKEYDHQLPANKLD